AVKDGLTISAAVPRKSELKAWPDRVTLEVQYPIEDWQTLKTITEIPDAPIAIATGMEWKVEDGRGLNDRKPAAVLRCKYGKGDWQLHNYLVECYLKGQDEPQREAYATAEGNSKS